MSQFEASHAIPKDIVLLEVPLPNKPDRHWCEIFDNAFANSGNRTRIAAFWYILAAQPLNKHARVTMPSYSYEHVPEELENAGAIFDGEVAGTKVVWAENNNRILAPDLHIAIKDVKEVTTQEDWFETDETIWVSLSEEHEIVLYER